MYISDRITIETCVVDARETTGSLVGGLASAHSVHRACPWAVLQKKGYEEEQSQRLQDCHIFRTASRSQRVGQRRLGASTDNQLGRNRYAFKNNSLGFWRHPCVSAEFATRLDLELTLSVTRLTLCLDSNPSDLLLPVSSQMETPQLYDSRIGDK